MRPGRMPNSPARFISLEGIDGAQSRLGAAGQQAHVDSLDVVYDKLKKLLGGG